MKVAISVPDPIFNAADRLAKQRQMARSQLFTEALEEYVSRHSTEAITAKLNDVYAANDAGVEKSISRAQFATVKHETW